MKLNRCPICHSLFDVMALAQDEATRKVLAILAHLDTLTGCSLLGYLSLFCPPKSQLSASRTLAILQELEGLGEWHRLGLGMATMVEIMHAKKREGEVVKQFTNHNYLLKVMESVPDQVPTAITGMPSQPIHAQSTHKTSAGMQAIADLEDMKHRER